MRRGGLGALVTALLALGLAPGAQADHVLMVGTYQGKPGQFTNVQAAINAAAPGDWVLVSMGLAVERISETDAAETLRLLDELESLAAGGEFAGADDPAEAPS